MSRFKSFFRRLSSKRVRLEKPERGVDWAEGSMSGGRREGEWVEQLGDRIDRSTWVDGKKHGPSRVERDDGSVVIVREFFDDLKHGEFRSFHENGTPYCTCRFERGNLVGRYTHHDDQGNLTVDFTSVAGERQGLYRELAANGAVTLEGVYDKGKREGVFTKRNDAGVTIEIASYVNDVLEGAWSSYFEDGKKKCATTYRAGVPGPFDIGSRADSHPLPPVAADTPQDAELFIALADALDSANDDRIERALAACPASLARDAVRICDAYGFAGFVIFSLRRAFNVTDPRFALAKKIIVDHASMSGAHIEAMRAMLHLVELSLHEVDIEGSLKRLFESGSTLRLARLGLTECHGASIIDGLIGLASSHVAETIEKLTLDIADHADHARAMQAIVTSSRFIKLTSLRVGYELDHAIDALARGPAWPSLSELVITDDLSDDARARLSAALEARQFPALSVVRIGEETHPWPAAGAGNFATKTE